VLPASAEHTWDASNVKSVNFRMISTDHCCRQYTVYRSVVLPYTVTHTHHYRTRSRSNSNNRSGPISARTCVCCCLCGLAVGGFGCGKRFGCCGYGFGGKDGMLQAPGCSAIPALLAGTAHAFSLHCKEAPDCFSCQERNTPLSNVRTYTTLFLELLTANCHPTS